MLSTRQNRISSRAQNWQRVLCCAVLAGLWLVSRAETARAQFRVEGPAPGAVQANPARAAGQREAGFEDVQFDPFLLGVVQHRTLQVRPEEAEAYYQLLDHVRKTDPARQLQAALANVKRFETQFRQQPGNARKGYSLFAEVLHHPENYTGDLLFMQGSVRKCLRHPPDPERPKDPPIYELWVFPYDSQHNPAVILCAELPPGFPVGGDILEAVDVAGYFFKIYGYRAQDTLRVAPMLVARKFTWRPRAKVERDPRWIYYVLTVGGILTALGLTAYGMRRGRSRSAEPLPETIDTNAFANLPVEGDRINPEFRE